MVGATYPAELVQLRRELPGVPFLVPGYGAQGGTAADVAGAFTPDGLGAVVNSSRGFTFAYNQPAGPRLSTGTGLAGGRSSRAVHAMAADLAEHTPAGRLGEGPGSAEG